MFITVARFRSNGAKKNIAEKITGNKLSEETIFEYLQKTDPVILSLYMSFEAHVGDVYIDLITDDELDIREFSRQGGIALIEKMLKDNNIVRQVRCQIRERKVNKTHNHLYDLFGRTLTVR